MPYFFLTPFSALVIVKNCEGADLESNPLIGIGIGAILPNLIKKLSNLWMLDAKVNKMIDAC